MKKLNVIVKAMTPAAIKRTEWREVKPGIFLGYRKVRFAGAVRLVPAVDESGKQWQKPAFDRFADARNLSDSRKLLGMTQRELAEELGLSVRTVEAWESGQRSPSGSARKLLEKLVDERKKKG